MYLLVTYDIVSDKRRRKIDKLLSEYGYRVNYSVFELEVDPAIYRTLRQKLLELMQKRDSVRFYRHTKETIRKSEELNPVRSHPFAMEESYVL